MSNKIMLVIVLLVLIGGGYYFFNKMYQPNQQPTVNQQPTTQPTQNKIEGNVVNISNFAFSPETLTIKQGTTVTWINQDTVGHTIKSSTFNSGMLNQGDKFAFTFDSKGSFDYSCGVHPSMTGKIVVE